MITIFQQRNRQNIMAEEKLFQQQMVTAMNGLLMLSTLFTVVTIILMSSFMIASPQPRTPPTPAKWYTMLFMVLSFCCFVFTTVLSLIIKQGLIVHNYTNKVRSCSVFGISAILCAGLLQCGACFLLQALFNILSIVIGINFCFVVLPFFMLVAICVAFYAIQLRVMITE